MKKERGRNDLLEGVVSDIGDVPSAPSFSDVSARALETAMNCRNIFVITPKLPWFPQGCFRWRGSLHRCHGLPLL